MNTLERNAYTDTWRAFGAPFRASPPRAILAVSAHWYIGHTAVTAMEWPRTIHDFGGFPDELFQFQYPAPGDPTLADEVAELVHPTAVGRDTGWGLDHGTWSVLAHLFPDADVPVVQLAIDATLTAEQHVAMGAALAPLRSQGVLVVASGNVVHNLRMLRPDMPDTGFDWAIDFEETSQQLLAEHPADVARLTEHPAYRLAAPTPDHLIPLYYLAGLAAAAGDTTNPLITGYQLGALSMTSHLLP